MPESKLWVDRLPRPLKPEIIVIRHGESEYKESGLDLTDMGIAQVLETAEALRGHLADFESVTAVSSPASRAVSTARLFLKTTGIDHEDDLRLNNKIRSVEIKDLSKFLAYDREHSTPRYGEMWLTDPFLETDNPLTEGRASVNNRAAEFLRDYGNELAAVAEETGVVAAGLVFTHMEVAVGLLKGGIAPEAPEFPIKEFPVLENAEPIVIQLDDPGRGEYTIIARGKRSEVRYNPLKRLFERRK